MPPARGDLSRMPGTGARAAAAGTASRRALRRTRPHEKAAALSGRGARAFARNGPGRPGGYLATPTHVVVDDDGEFPVETTSRPSGSAPATTVLRAAGRCPMTDQLSVAGS